MTNAAVMAQPKFEEQLRRSTEKLMADLRVLIRQAAQESVRQALTARSGAPTSRRRTPSMPPLHPHLEDAGGEAHEEEMPDSTRTLRRPTTPLNEGAGEVTSGTRLGKRSRQAVEALTDRLLEYIEHNPGQRMEEISAGLGVPSSELTLPMRNLVRENHLRTLGEKRATIYFAR
jgi:hypothetical protein